MADRTWKTFYTSVFYSISDQLENFKQITYMPDLYDTQIAITTVRSRVRDVQYKGGRTVKRMFSIILMI